MYGRLATDRTHQFGGQFLYSFPFGFNVGVNQYIGSGTPISTMGSIPSNNAFYPYGRGDVGETPWFTQTDLTLYYTLNFGRNLGLSFGLTVLNLFDQDTEPRKWATHNSAGHRCHRRRLPDRLRLRREGSRAPRDCA